MPATKETKKWALSIAIEIAKKAAEGGGFNRGVELAYAIQDCYATILKIHEEEEPE